jgi:hypothetical protein
MFLGYVGRCAEDVEVFQLQELDLCFMSCVI